MTTRPAIADRLRTYMRTQGSSDRGSASLEIVIIMPVIFMIIFGGVQTGLYYYARNVAVAAAQEGARAAGAQDGTASGGAAAASTFIVRAGGDNALPSATVSGARSATTATVQVRGRSLSLIPGYAGIDISQAASVPVERLTR